MKLIFERGAEGRGLSLLPACDVPEACLPEAREIPLHLPQVSENELLRHYTALCKQVYGVNDGFYPLGSCTMKYNPKIDEEMAALIEVAESMIDDGIRDGFDRESPQAKMLAKLLVTDLDDYRELTAAEANSMRYLTQSLKMQLRYKDVSNLDTSGGGEV